MPSRVWRWWVCIVVLLVKRVKDGSRLNVLMLGKYFAVKTLFQRSRITKKKFTEIFIISFLIYILCK